MQNTKAQHHQRRDQVTWNVPLRAQFENISTLKRRRPHPPRKQANFSPQRKLHLPEKTQCFVEILTFKSHPWFVKTQLSREPSFKRRVEEVKTKLSCEASFKFDSTQLDSTQLYSTLLCLTLLRSTLHNSSLPKSTLLCSTQLYSTQPYS